MLTLYMKPTCAFSRHVIATADRLGLALELKDIVANESYAEELMGRGGKRQTPYLADSDAGVEMYESDSIIAHLQLTYGPPASDVVAPRPRIHMSDSTCVSCEA